MPDLEFLTNVGSSLGISGLIVGGFVLLYRDFIRKSIFPSLTKKQAFLILIVFLFFVWSFSLLALMMGLNSSQEQGKQISINSPSITGRDNLTVNIEYKDKQQIFGKLSAVNVSNNLVVGLDENGQEWKKAFRSKIISHHIADLNLDGNDDVLVGLSSEGEQNSTLIALSSSGRVLWEYKKDGYQPYLGPNSGSFNVRAITTVKNGGEIFVIAVFNIKTWYQSAMLLFDANGKVVNTMWHPGRIYEIETLDKTIVARAHNNDLRQAIAGSDPSVSYSVVFALELSDIYGEAPPYYGKDKPNDDFKWYYVLRPQDETLRNLTLVPDGVRVWSKCGKAFYFHGKGIQRKIGKSDFYTCQGEVQFVSLKI